jgi:monovalent cation/hydrogen antiporter
VTATIQTLLLLIAVLFVVAIVARRFNTAPSILLVIAGIGLALIPGLPRIELAPELVLFGILPPLIYSAGVAMSWREFRFNLRPITLLAVGCVIFTTCAVAAVAHWLLGIPLAVGFVLGAIESPPDVVAPLAIVRRLGVLRRLIVVLEGEGLANDATALILYRFAVACGRQRRVLPGGGRGNVCPHRGRRDCLRHWLGLAQSALAPLGARPPDEATTACAK